MPAAIYYARPLIGWRLLLALLYLLALAPSASAESAWVLRQRDDSFDARGALVSSATAVFATYTTSAECVTAIDGLERQWQQRPQVVVMRDARPRLPGAPSLT